MMDEKDLAAIQEMARTCCVSYSVGECYSGNKCYDNCALYLKAKELYKAGYRKPNDNDVVIGKDEYERLRLKATNNEYDEIRDKLHLFEYATSEARKEATKEILSKLHYELANNGLVPALVKVFDLAKEYGVEVE